jgi:hypothetical protein
LFCGGLRVVVWWLSWVEGVVVVGLRDVFRFVSGWKV